MYGIFSFVSIEYVNCGKTASSRIYIEAQVDAIANVRIKAAINIDPDISPILASCTLLTNILQYLAIF